MRRRKLGIVLGLCLLLAAHSAQAATYSFPYAGVRLEPQEGWTVLTPQTLDEEDALLSQLGADKDTLRADYALYGTVLEAYLPSGAQVRLNVVQTEETQAWQAMVQMSGEEMEAFLEGYRQSPYENVGWAEDLPGYVRCDWTMQAGGIPLSFAGLFTVRQGMLYSLIASGASVSTEALHTANREVLERMEYLQTDVAAASVETGLAEPEPVADDGAVTPIELVDFSVITYDDSTALIVQSLPETDLMLYTATDSLRARTDADGRHVYQVSTRRTNRYSYTLSAKAQDRRESTLEIVLERRLTDEQREEEFRKSAREINAIGGYSKIGGAAFAGQAITFRGSVGEISDYGGFPIVLIYTDNPRTGVWQNPIWVILTQAASLTEDGLYTVYGELRGQTLPYTGVEGGAGEAPVVISHSIQE